MGTTIDSPIPCLATSEVCSTDSSLIVTDTFECRVGTVSFISEDMIRISIVVEHLHAFSGENEGGILCMDLLCIGDVFRHQCDDTEDTYAEYKNSDEDFDEGHS